jgi:hypothetical protein
MADYEFDLSELDSEADFSEKAPKRPSSQPSFKSRPPAGTPSAVTQAQLEAALTRVDGKIKTVADGVSTINSRLASIASATKKEVEERKKGVDSQSKDLNQKLQMLALLPLLIQTPTAANPTAGGNPLLDSSGNKITAISKPDTNNLDSILPLLLVSGLGGTGSSGGLGLGGDGSDGGIMLLALALAFANPNKSS